MVTPDNPPEALTVHPEIHKIAVDRLLDRNGVTTLYHGLVCGVLMRDNQVIGVEAALRDGRARIQGAVTIDATGDADIAYHAGVGWSLDQELQPLTYHFRLGGIDRMPDWKEWERITRVALETAHAAGELGVFGGPWVIRMNADEISLNTTRVYGNPVDPVSLSAAEKQARAQMIQIWNILRRRVPQLERSYILAGASQLHIRESRKIHGEYMLKEEDIRQGTRFSDAIAVGAWPIDIHPINGGIGVHPHKDDAPVPYEIPFRCLVPRGTDGLLVAGKPISTTHRAHGSTRVPGTSIATGQAAGVAASIAVSNKIAPRSVDPSVLRTRLRAQKAIVSASDRPPDSKRGDL